MCEPTTVLAIASTVAATAQQQRAASAQKRVNIQQTGYANQQMVANLDQSNLADQQNIEDATNRQREVAIRGAQARSTVVAGATGIGGLSVDALLRDLSGQQLRQEDAIQTNVARQGQSSTLDRTNTMLRRDATVAGLPAPRQPDYLGAALKIGSQAYGGYSDYQKTLKPGG